MTPSEPVVLVLTVAGDRHLEAVRVHLDDCGVQVHLTDPATLATPPASLHARIRSGHLRGELDGVPLHRVAGVWHRRPSDIDIPDRGHAAELRSGLGGVLACLPYLNHPADMASASFKPYQLAVAARAGLTVPETVISTDREQGEALAERFEGRVVVKPMSGTNLVPRLVTEDDRTGWDRPIHLTQQRIDTRRHIRLTVVDDRMFAAQIDSLHLDWRHDHTECRYTRVEVPGGVWMAVNRLMGALRLRYGALDFAVDDAGVWWFLEINPNGQWLWIEDETGLPISNAIAQALIHAPAPLRPEIVWTEGEFIGVPRQRQNRRSPLDQPRPMATEPGS